MGRKRKPGLDYFPFDTDFFTNKKIVCIAGEFGIKGEMVAIKLLCAIYRNGYFMEWSESAKYTLLTQLPGISVSLLDQIVVRLVRWGFFDASLFDSVRILTSESIQRRYFEAAKWRKLDKKMEYLLVEDFKNYSEENGQKNDFPIKKPHFPKINADFPKINPINKIKKEIKISSPLPPKGAVGDVAKAKEKILKDFFSKQIALEQFCMSEKTSPEELRRLADAVFAEWELVNEADVSEKHLINALRIKIKISHETDRQIKVDRLSERRGTPPDVSGQEDYSDTL